MYFKKMKISKDICLFIRFLKEHNAYKWFIERFYSNGGKEFRSMYYDTMDLVDVNIMFYFQYVPSKNYIFDAFDWLPDDVWSTLHHEWCDYLRKSKLE